MSKKNVFYLLVLVTLFGTQTKVVNAREIPEPPEVCAKNELEVCYRKGVTADKAELDAPCCNNFDCVHTIDRYSDQISVEVGRCRKKGIYSCKDATYVCYQSETNGSNVTIHESCCGAAICDLGEETHLETSPKEKSTKLLIGRCVPVGNSCGKVDAECKLSISNPQSTCCDGTTCGLAGVSRSGLVGKCKRPLCSAEGQPCGNLGANYGCCSPETVCKLKQCVSVSNPSYSNEPLPGYNCGDGRDTKKRKCCYSAQVAKKTLKDQIKDALGNHCVFFSIALCTDAGVDTIFDILGNTKQGKEMLATEKLESGLIACEKGEPYIGGDPTDDYSNPECYCHMVSGGEKICRDYINNADELSSCIDCTNGTKPRYSSRGIWTGIGCVYTNINDFVTRTVFGWGVGLAGMLAFFCIIYSSIILQTSKGNPEKLKKAQEMLTSCIIGLILILFSVLILKVIGVDILRIPGFK